MELTDSEVVQKDGEALYIGNLNTVEADLTLPVRGKYGAHICWESEQEHYVTPEGRVTRPLYGTGNRTVKLTAFLTYGSAARKREFKVTLLEKKKEMQVLEVYPIQLEGQINNVCYLPFYVPVRTEVGCCMNEVIWECGTGFQSEKIGIYEVTGYLKDRKWKNPKDGEIEQIPAVAYIDVQEKKNREDHIPESSNTEAAGHTSIENVVRAVSLADGKGPGVVILTGKSEFFKAQERMLTFLLGTDDDQMLYNFRREAGLDIKGASPMIGWDSPECLVRGHTTGHYLSALALCFRATGEARILKKAEYMVESLGQCQRALSEQKGYHPGFLSAYPEEQFDLLEAYTPYPEIWAPYYTLHKILAGLLDCEKWTGIAEALEIADKIGEWIFRRLTKLNEGQRMKMWSIYIAGEFGGINESLAELYMRTGKEIHLQSAEMFDNDRLFLPMGMKQDALDGMHANQHIPQAIGAMKIYEASGDRRYYDIAKFFWESVTAGHCYAIGGTGETEMFHGRNKIGSFLTENTAESCASYNMLKLTKLLYQYEPLASYMDYYERTMQNHILASLDKEPSGETVYFLPLGPGFIKKFETENTCCHGTGMENHFKYIESVYFQDKDTLYINLFLESKACWQERGISIRQIVQEERPGEIKLYLQRENQESEKAEYKSQTPESGKCHLKIRRPYWCAGEHRVTVNGKTKICPVQEDGYLNLTMGDDEWEEAESGISISIHFPCSLRLERTPDNAELAALAYGPYIFAALSEQKDYLDIPLREDTLEEVFTREESSLAFRYRTLKFIPLYQVSREAYHVYFSVGRLLNKC